MAHLQNLDFPDEILSLPMFHADLCCRNKAETYVLQNSKEEGSFILRPNTNFDPSYISLTTRIRGNKTCNARILIDRSRGALNYYISDKMKFPNIHQLLSYYREHRIHCKDGIENLRLLFPLRKTRTPRNSLTGSKEQSLIIEQFRSNTGVTGRRGKDDGDGSQFGRTGSTVSDSQVLPAPKMQHGGSLKTPYSSKAASKEKERHQHFGKNRSQSASQIKNLPGMNKQDPRFVMTCRPPAPLPRLDIESADDSFYYTTIEANKDFFRETYAFLKENEKCECGLRIVDSELDLGWAIHRSQDRDTLNHIFFQRDEVTTWDMPADLVHRLTKKQIQFILYLCWEGKQSVPTCLRERLDKELEDFGSF